MESLQAFIDQIDKNVENFKDSKPFANELFIQACRRTIDFITRRVGKLEALQLVKLFLESRSVSFDKLTSVSFDKLTSASFDKLTSASFDNKFPHIFELELIYIKELELTSSVKFKHYCTSENIEDEFNIFKAIDEMSDAIGTLNALKLFRALCLENNCIFEFDSDFKETIKTLEKLLLEDD